MFDAMRQILLRALRVPDTPHPPAGSPQSTEIFRAGRAFYKLALLKWAIPQIGIAFALLLALTALGPFYSIGFPHRVWPDWLRQLSYVLEALAAAAFLIQLPFSYAAVRLNYEMRWYIVTDRSLRIRSGIWDVEELTMTFANIQQVNLQQGPLQRVLGIADLEVASAGGGKPQGKGESRAAHVGRFEGVNNALAIRDLILDRLRQYRDAGLGDPDDHHRLAPLDTLEAAREALGEARQLHATLRRPQAG